MKEIQKTFYQCEYCNREFDKKTDAEWHEKRYHICPNCEHAYWLYGCEFNCDMGKNKCHFEEKKINK